MIEIKRNGQVLQAAFNIVVGFCLIVGCSNLAAKQAATGQQHSGYVSYQIGDISARTTGKTAAGLMLMGGAREVDAAFAWLVANAGHGHIVILRASGDDELQNYFFHTIGNVASVQTLIFHNRKASSDPAVLDIVRHADGIFIAGGDQANYVRFWKDTPLNALIDAHVRAGKPIGGTSAGLAILGAYAYGAMDGGSMVSPDAMNDPLGKGMTLVNGFLHMPYLQHVITDSHFSARKRLGRLIAFIAKLRHEGHVDAVGIGVDENTALCIDSRGIGRVFTGSGGFAWLVIPNAPPARIEDGKPLRYQNVGLTGIGTQSRIDMHDLRVDRPAFRAMADVDGGKLRVRGNIPQTAVLPHQGR
ncbi:MAG: cyanophycinase [Rudaea sp.]